MINVSSQPLQRLSMSKKGKDWRENNLRYFVSKYKSDSSKFDDIKTNTNLYHSIYDEKDIQYVTNPFKVKEGFPASPHNFNIIKPKIDLLVGEVKKDLIHLKYIILVKMLLVRFKKRKLKH